MFSPLSNGAGIIKNGSVQLVVRCRKEFGFHTNPLLALFVQLRKNHPIVFNEVARAMRLLIITGTLKKAEKARNKFPLLYELKV